MLSPRVITWLPSANNGKKYTHSWPSYAVLRHKLLRRTLPGWLVAAGEAACRTVFPHPTVTNLVGVVPDVNVAVVQVRQQPVTWSIAHSVAARNQVFQVPASGQPLAPPRACFLTSLPAGVSTTPPIIEELKELS